MLTSNNHGIITSQLRLGELVRRKSWIPGVFAIVLERWPDGELKALLFAGGPDRMNPILCLEDREYPSMRTWEVIA